MSPRDWAVARHKCAEEGERCRICGRHGVEAAHVIPRSLGGRMLADSIVPLCKRHHDLYDDGKLDLMPVLTEAEFAEAIVVVGYERAVQRITPTRNPRRTRVD